MSAHVLLNLLNELGEKIRAWPGILSVFTNELKDWALEGLNPPEDWAPSFTCRAQDTMGL